MDGSVLSLIASFAPVDPPAVCAREIRTTSSPRLSQHAVDSRPRGVPEAARKHVVHLICFSKDRAFQLDQFLASASRHLLVGRSGIELSLRVSVLYVATGGLTTAKTTASYTTGTTATPAASTADIDNVQQQPQPRSTVHGDDQAKKEAGDMLASYNLVRRRHPAVALVQEKPETFCDQLVELLKEAEGREEAGAETPADCKEGDEQQEENNFVLFAVDDMFFYQDYDLSGAVRLLAKGESFCTMNTRFVRPTYDLQCVALRRPTQTGQDTTAQEKKSGAVQSVSGTAW